MPETFAAFSGVHFGVEVKTTWAGADGFIRRFKRRSLRVLVDGGKHAEHVIHSLLNAAFIADAYTST